MKVLSSFLLPIPLDRKRGRNKSALDKKAFSEAALLIFPLHNSFKNALLLLSLYLQIVLSRFHLPAAKLGVGVFGKDNVGKGREDDLGKTNADGRTGADNPSTETDANAGVDNLRIAAYNLGKIANNLSTATDDLGTAVDNSGIAADDLSTEMDTDIGADNPGIVTDNPGTGIDANMEADNLDTAASN